MELQNKRKKTIKVKKTKEVKPMKELIKKQRTNQETKGAISTVISKNNIKTSSNIIDSHFKQTANENQEFVVIKKNDTHSDF